MPATLSSGETLFESGPIGGYDWLTQPILVLVRSTCKSKAGIGNKQCLFKVWRSHQLHTSHHAEAGNPLGLFLMPINLSFDSSLLLPHDKEHKVL